MDHKTFENRLQMSPNRAQEGYPIGSGAPPDGVPQGPARKKPKKNKDPTKNALGLVSPAQFYAKKWPTWLQVGLPNRSKIEEKSMQKSIEKTMHLGIDFWRDFGGFLEAKWRHVGTKIEQKSMPTSKSDFLKKPCFSLGKTMILRVQGIEVGGKNR